MVEVGGRHFKILTCVVRATEYSAIHGALPLVKINNPYRKAYSIGCRSKSYVTNASAKRTIRGISVNCLLREIRE